MKLSMQVSSNLLAKIAEQVYLPSTPPEEIRKQANPSCRNQAHISLRKVETESRWSLGRSIG
jgi:hypothetical protein